MGTCFIMGRASSMLKERVIEKLAQYSPLTPVIVVVPPQATYKTECAILNKTGLSGMMGMSVISISKLCDRVLHETFGGAQKTIDAPAKSMRVARIIEENKSNLLELHKLKDHKVLPSQTVNLLSEMKKMDITPKMLREFAENKKQKFLDLALIYEELEKSEDVDAEDQMNVVISKIKDAEFIANSHVFFMGFDRMNAQMTRLCKEIISYAKSTVFSFLYADANAVDSKTYDICNENRMRLFDVASKNDLTVEIVGEDANISEDIVYMGKNLFTYPVCAKQIKGDVRIYNARSKEEEVRGVAAQIAKLIIDENYRFSDIAIACADMETYASHIKKVFTRAEIPHYIGEKRNILQSNFAFFVLSATELAQGRLKKDSLLAHLDTGYCDVFENRSNSLFRHAFSKFGDGYAFLKPFDNENIEKARMAFIGPIERLREKCKDVKSAKEILNYVEEYLAETKAEKKIQAEIRMLREKELFLEADLKEQEYKRIREFIIRSKETLTDTMINGKKLAMLLEVGMQAMTIATIPPGVNEVACLDVNSVYLSDIKTLFVIGCNDGVLPEYSTSKDLITDEEWESVLVGLKGIRQENLIEKQKLNITKMVSTPSERVVFSYVDDENSKASPIIGRLGRLFVGLREESIRDVAGQLKQNAFVDWVKNVRLAADGKANERKDGTVKAFFEDEQLQNEIELLKRCISNKNVAVKLGSNSAKGLYGDINTISTTQLECFYSCPYKYFMRYGLRAKQQREYEIAAVDAGVFAHSILEKLVKKYIDTQTDMQADSDAEFVEKINDCVREAQEQWQGVFSDERNTALLKALTKEVVLTAYIMREQNKDTMLKPYATEERFGDDNFDINGVIDRIDIAEVDGKKYFNLIDYKTGEKDFNLDKFISGVEVQLILYILAARGKLGDEFIFAGAWFMHVFGAMISREKNIMKEYKMKGILGIPSDITRNIFAFDEKGSDVPINIITKKDGNYDSDADARYYCEEEIDILENHLKTLIVGAKKKIRDGVNAILPYSDKNGKKPCDYCEYKSVCLFDEKCNDVRNIYNISKDNLAQEIANVENKLDNDVMSL